ncbi:gephyrin-like molybdotransferase Glp [Nocardioides sp. Bht2]|uniref:molybdotransferase-like divisome protein Glp n=1 Tax=Nocardioides sp. Bht2 TaxID=3392297 RepID=UPI0039B47803
MAEPVAVADHLARVLAGVEPLSTHKLKLLDALGHPVAEDVVAPIALPRFDNSAMDGYAVQFRDVSDARHDRPIHLPVVAEFGAGPTTSHVLEAGTAVKIMTGAPIPIGCDAVVPYEWTDRGSDEVLISQPPTRGQNIRRAGDDVEEGEVVVSAGTVLGPRQIGLLAAVGRAEVLTRPRPRVVVISTGSELRDPGEALEPGTIFDANSFLLAAAVRAAGGIAYRVGAVSDDSRSFAEALEDELTRADLVITSGGISEGDFDVVKEALRGDLWFGKLAMQPGKPQGFGLFGAQRTPVITLPGNPVSSYVSFRVFVVPAIRKLLGRTPFEQPLRSATLSHGLTSSPGRQQYVRAFCESSVVTPVGGSGSHLLGDLATSNALIVVPAETTSLAPGDPVSVLMLDEEF